jgi:hypothetical protein
MLTIPQTSDPSRWGQIVGDVLDFSCLINSIGVLEWSLCAVKVDRMKADQSAMKSKVPTLVLPKETCKKKHPMNPCVVGKQGVPFWSLNHPKSKCS